MPIEWEDLPQTFEHFPKTRTLDTIQNKFGENKTPVTAAPGQTFRGCLQTVRPSLRNQAEGLLPLASHLVYCNPTDAPGGQPLSMADGDQIKDSAGVRYRVVMRDAPAGDDGAPDHYKVYVMTVGVQGDAP